MPEAFFLRLSFGCNLHRIGMPYLVFGICLFRRLQLILQLTEAGLLTRVFLASSIQLSLHIRNLSPRRRLFAFQALDMRSNAADQLFAA